MFLKYRNSNARHTYETDTKKEIAQLRKVDQFLESKKGLTNSTMQGANHKRVNGETNTNKIVNSFTAQNISSSIVDSITNHNAIASFIKDNIDQGGDKK